eukprot:79383-Chlamydomonas_euryale.AAC.1
MASRPSRPPPPQPPSPPPSPPSSTTEHNASTLQPRPPAPPPATAFAVFGAVLSSAASATVAGVSNSGCTSRDAPSHTRAEANGGCGGCAAGRA